MRHPRFEHCLRWHFGIGLLGSAIIVLGGCVAESTLPDESTTRAEAPLSCDDHDPSLVRLASGTVKGNVAPTYREFLGIPYAAPPTGEARWKPPTPAAPWGGVRDATREGNRCPQIVQQAPEGIPTPENPPTSSVAGNEDCLVLNVTTPNRQGMSKLPVMVWIHGGGFNGGQGNDGDRHRMVAREDVIIVSMNYRLGALGFLAHPALTAESRDHSGNYGVLDQQAALAWVKSNIARFGGDPHNVTIAGLSAGGNSVWNHVVSPLSAGLFQRAITMSGSWFSDWNWLGFDWPVPPFERSFAESQSVRFAEAVHCSGTSSSAAVCLRNASVTDLILESGGGFGPAFYTWGPVVGGAVVPSSIRDALAMGRFNRVPIINGATHDENSIAVEIVFWVYMRSPMTAESYAEVVAQRFGGDAPRVLAEYPVEAYASPIYAYAAVESDLQNACMTRRFNQFASAHTTVYAYEFNDAEAPYKGWEGIFSGAPPFPPKAYHGSDYQYLFRSPSQDADFTPSQLMLSDQMIDYWTNFAKRGAPLGNPFWAPYRRSFDAVQSLAPGAIGPVSNFSSDHHCNFWKELRGI